MIWLVGRGTQFKEMRDEPKNVGNRSEYDCPLKKRDKRTER